MWAGDSLVRLPSEFLRTPFEETYVEADDEEEEDLTMASRPWNPPV